jgi:hypothetical protein
MTLIDKLRKPKVGPFSVFDVAAALGGAYWLAPKIGMKRNTAMLISIPAGVLVHELLGIDTPLNRMIFRRAQGSPGGLEESLGKLDNAVSSWIAAGRETGQTKTGARAARKARRAAKRKAEGFGRTIRPIHPGGTRGRLDLSTPAGRSRDRAWGRLEDDASEGMTREDRKWRIKAAIAAGAETGRVLGTGDRAGPYDPAAVDAERVQRELRYQRSVARSIETPSIMNELGTSYAAQDRARAAAAAEAEQEARTQAYVTERLAAAAQRAQDMVLDTQRYDTVADAEARAFRDKYSRHTGYVTYARSVGRDPNTGLRVSDAATYRQDPPRPAAAASTSPLASFFAAQGQTVSSTPAPTGSFTTGGFPGGGFPMSSGPAYGVYGGYRRSGGAVYGSGGGGGGGTAYSTGTNGLGGLGNAAAWAAQQQARAQKQAAATARQQAQFARIYAKQQAQRAYTEAKAARYDDRLRSRETYRQAQARRYSYNRPRAKPAPAPGPVVCYRFEGGRWVNTGGQLSGLG